MVDPVPATLRERFYRHVAQTSLQPPGLIFASADGCELIGQDGKRYLDLISGISVSNLGHGHPRVREAIHRQADRFLHVMVYGEFILSPQVALATRLAGVLPDRLDSCYFTNSGSEAVEGALKLAKRATGRSELISFRNSYHGSTHGALSVGGAEWQKRAFRPLLPDVLQLTYNSLPELSFITERTAAVILEPIQAEAGVIVPDAGYLAAVRKRCDDTGALMILDEVQTGMGRTGTLFRFEAEGIVPDILLLGKAFGAGLPLAAFIAAAPLMRQLAHDPVLGHITTFGGHPLSCAAADAGLKVLQEERLHARARVAGERFVKQLKHSRVLQIRGEGLLLALDLGSEEAVQRIIPELAAQGIITDWFLFAPDCLRLAPPLVIDDETIDRACSTLRNCLDAL
jgi:acetylornithine/succinyldiaminopimelate/putrescine aminotransferase